MSLNELEAQALLRIEKKLDELLRLAKEAGVKQGTTHLLQQMKFDKQVCPLCNKRVEYFVSERGNFGEVIRRECGCVPPKEEKDNG